MSKLTTSALLLFTLLSSCQSPSQPPVAEATTYLLDESQLEEYERDLDHAQFMQDWSEEFYHRGLVTYRESCFACHGNIEQPGSIPNSRQFWSQPFKNGADPYSMYQTLTRGHGLMPPQVHLTPQENTK